jgi:AcrR family transcriptional regulator
MAEATTMTTAKAGRPRCFCEDTALDAAMRVFWEKGYEGASLTELTEAMGINRPSLYAAFGDKAALFQRAMERYVAGPAGYVQKALAETTAREVVEALLRGAVEMLGDPGNPRGCMSVQGALACGVDSEPVKEMLVEWRRQGEAAIQKRMKRAAAEGDLPKGVDAKDLGRYVSTVLTGLGVQAASGASKAEMSRVVEMALRTLPV